MSRLSDAFNIMDDVQKDAVRFLDDMTVLAGPGSGKTDTLVVKAAYLASQRIVSPYRLACVTFANDTARELLIRIRRLGCYDDSRFYVGTLHSFCWSQVIQPFASLAGARELSERGIATEAEVNDLLQSVLDRVGIEENVQWFAPTLTRVRRALACQEDAATFGDDRVEAARMFERVLAERELVDFEAMVIEALRLLTEHDAVRRLLAVRYRWLLVDEYQDLGGVLHRIAMVLKGAGVRLGAFGDPNQSIYAFAGAEPRYLADLAEQRDIVAFRLRTNYRSATSIVDASESFRGHGPDLRAMSRRGAEQGEILVFDAGNGAAAQADLVSQRLIPWALERGVDLDDIALLYRQRGIVPDELVRALRAHDWPFVLEREGGYPRSPICRWLQRCGYAALHWREGRPSLGDIAADYRWRRGGISRGEPETEIQDVAYLYGALAEPSNADDRALDWIGRLDERLDLRTLLANHPNGDNELADLEALVTALSDGRAVDLTLNEFGSDSQGTGKIVLTTLHGSKGRQFDVVMMVGLQERLIPKYTFDRRLRTWVPVTGAAMEEERRLFYVGITRPRSLLFLVFSNTFTDERGRVYPPGPSRFVQEMVPPRR